MSFFVISAAEESMPGLEIYSRGENKAAASKYQTVFTQTRPMVEQWLGARLKQPVVLVDLPDGNDLPFEHQYPPVVRHAVGCRNLEAVHFAFAIFSLARRSLMYSRW